MLCAVLLLLQALLLSSPVFALCMPPRACTLQHA